MLDVRTAQTEIENLIRDTILYGLGHRQPSVPNLADLRALPLEVHRARCATTMI